MKLRWLAGSMVAVLVSATAAHAQTQAPPPLACLPQPGAVTVTAIDACVDELRATAEMVLGACLSQVRDGTAPDSPTGAILGQVSEWITGNGGRGLTSVGITIIGIGPSPPASPPTSPPPSSPAPISPSPRGL